MYVPLGGKTRQCVEECCSVLQCVAVCCSVLQRVAACCSVLQCVVVASNEEECHVCQLNPATYRNTSQHMAGSLHVWIVRYMYVPLGGKTRRLLVVWPIFVFVGLWHDLEIRWVAWYVCVT